MIAMSHIVHTDIVMLLEVIFEYTSSYNPYKLYARMDIKWSFYGLPNTIYGWHRPKKPAVV